MSRIVPEDRALSDEDRAYLVHRGVKQSLIARLDEEFPRTTKPVEPDEDKPDGKK